MVAFRPTAGLTFALAPLVVLALEACGGTSPEPEGTDPGVDAGGVSGDGGSSTDANRPEGDGQSSADAGGAAAGDFAGGTLGPCGDGTWDHDDDSATSCAPWTTCPAGTHVSGAPSAEADRTCAGCPSGTFSGAANAPSCTTWSTCLAGTYASSPGSDVGDRVCTPCPAGTYSSSPNQASCVPLGECAAGTVQTAPATATKPPVCAPCEAGTYCAGGTTPKAACAAGTWDHDTTAATVCVAWTSCVAGQIVSGVGSTTSDRTCANCASGFSTTTNATSCTPWSNCSPGTYVSATATATADRKCTACPANYTSTTTNAAACDPLPVGLAAGATSTCARFANGTVRCWGRNTSGQLGDGTYDHRNASGASVDF